MKPIYLIIFLLLSVLNVNAEEPPLINVSAEGIVKAKTDIARMHLDIISSELDAAAAREKTDIQMKKLLKLLKKYDIKEGSLDSSQTSISADYDYNVQPRKLIAYRANRSISFTLTNLSQLENVIQEVSKLDLVSMQQAQFSVQEERYWQDLALKAAIELAKEKAALMAQALNVQLDGLYRVTHQVNRINQPVYARSMEMKMDHVNDGSYEQKDLEISAYVDLAFRFK